MSLAGSTSCLLLCSSIPQWDGLSYMAAQICCLIGIIDATARRPSDSLQGLIHNAGHERVIGDELIDRDMTVFSFSFYARV
jgi:hypothetical protein